MIFKSSPRELEFARSVISGGLYLPNHLISFSNMAQTFLIKINNLFVKKLKWWSSLSSNR